MEALILGIFAVCLFAFVLMPRQQHPMVVYVERAPARGLGCLPLLLLLGTLLFIAFGLSAR